MGARRERGQAVVRTVDRVTSALAAKEVVPAWLEGSWVVIRRVKKRPKEWF